MLQHGSSSLLRSPERSQALEPTNASNIFRGSLANHPSIQGLVMLLLCVCVLIYSSRHTEFHSLRALKQLVFFHGTPVNFHQGVFCCVARTLLGQQAFIQSTLVGFMF